MVWFYLGFLPSQAVSLAFILFISLIDEDSRLANQKSRDDVHFRKFRRQLLHSSLAKILESLKPGMTIPEVVRCPDGHF
jgi:hypothetical protein